MHLSLNWIKKFVPEFEIEDAQQFKLKIDTRLSEVEQVVEIGGSLDKLTVGKVVSVEPHPQHENLFICSVEVGEPKPLTIVCGAANVRKDMYTVVVLTGGTVYDSDMNPQNISSHKFGKVKSEGMLCAPDELGLGGEHAGIIEIDNSVAPGTDVTEMFQDIVFEIENKALTHRPDAFGHMGVAREISAIFELPMVEKAYEIPKFRAETELEFEVKNNIPNLVKRYSGICLANIQVGPSPLWLQIALARVGERSINNVVDITNYVMHHLGQPLHAFDVDLFSNNKIELRTAAEGEVFRTLDGVDRELSSESVLITDGDKPVALGGIMGGENTEISIDTTQVFLEAANFEMFNIRRTSRELGLRTQASTRFEKGLSPELTLTALNYAADLLVTICGAEVASETVDSYPEPQQPQKIDFDLSQIKRLSGTLIDKKAIANKLQYLGFKIEGIEKFTPSDLSRSDVGLKVQVKVPYWRQDIKQTVDIVEEVVRLHGYENIEFTLPMRSLSAPRPNKLQQWINNIKTDLSVNGLWEIYTYSMVGDELYANCRLPSDNLIEIMDGISPELSKLRDNLLPSLIEKASENIDRYNNFGLFEISRIAQGNKSLPDSNLPAQPWQLAAVRVGKDLESTYRELKQSFDTINQIYLANQARIKSADTLDVFHPGRSGAIVLAGETVGHIGAIHPTVANNFSIESESVVAYWINLSEVYANLPAPSEFENIHNFPIVNRDVSFWQKPKTYLQDTLDTIKTKLESNIFDIEVTDIFDRAEQRSVTLNIKLQSTENTLDAEQIDQLMQEVYDVISNAGHEIR